MATVALGLVGAAVGGAFGMPGLGFTIGSAIGRAFFTGATQQYQTMQMPGQEGPRLSDLKVQSSTYGTSIPLIYGTYRVSGNMIWATDIVERSTTTTTTSTSTSSSSGGGGGGKGGGGGGGGGSARTTTTITQTTTTYSYYGNFAIGLCAGPILGIRRIWADGKPIYNTSANASTQTVMASSTHGFIRVYNGDEGQLPDPLLEAHQGAGNVPAFRGLAYIVFENFALADFGNHVPNITVEVVQVGSQNVTLNNLVTSVSRSIGNPVGQAYDFDGGVIHTKIGGDEWGHEFPPPAGPQRIDLDLNLNVVQRIVGANLESNQAYHQNIKYMPNLFVTFNINYPYKWYDVSTSQHYTLKGDGHQPQMGAYANGFVFLATAIEQQIYNNSIIKYPVAGKFSVPDNFSQVVNFYGYFTSNVGYIVDMDIKNSYLFVSTLESSGPKILAIDPNSLAIVKKWNVSLGGNVSYNISVNSSGTQALLTKIEFNNTNAYLVNLDFNASTISTYTDLTSHSGGNGAFFFLNDHFAYAGGLTTFGSTSYASLQGVNTVEPETPLLAAIVQDICLKAGLGLNDIDVSLLGNNIVGYAISQQSSARDSLTPLQSAYFFDVVESGFKLKFVPRGLASPVIIPEDDLSAREYGQEEVPDLTTTRAQELDLPRRMNVLFTNINADYQQGNQIAQRIITQATTEQKIELSIAMADADAAKIADVLLYDAWTQRTQFEFSLSRKYAYLDPTDVVIVHGHVMRLINVDYGDPGLLKLKAVMEDETVYTSLATGDDVTTQSAPELPLPSPARLFLMDMPILQDIDDDYGFYACASGVLQNWPGAVVTKSIDGGDTYSEVYSNNTPGVYGMVLTQLPDHKTTVFDETSQVYVKLTSGELSSTTELNILNGANACVMGLEVLQFQYAELQPDGSYLLSRFLRGRRGTELATDLHVEGEAFILIDAATWKRVHSSESEIGIERVYKAITYGRTLQESYAQAFTNTAIGKKPYSPVGIRGSRDSDDLTITWIRRSRVGGSWRDYVDATIDPEITGYEVDVYDGDDVIRTLDAEDEEVVYTAADQTTDFGSPQSEITIKIYAIGQTVGRGFPREAIL
ncbi:MAG: phage tail protein [Gammaproteobacteria bacterium]|nr:phage tail protein [Gammaproteobacteria bacterium]